MLDWSRRPGVGRRTRPRVVAFAMLFLLVSASFSAPTVTAETTTVMSAQLATARDGTSTIFDGTHFYVFGGDDGVRKNDIMRYDPVTDTLTTMSATLPSPRSGTSAIWDGTHAYIFGGWNGSPYSDQIVRYDPDTDTVTVMSATLPTGRYYTSAVWSGERAYIFGGGVTCSPCTSAQILEYDPANDTITTMAASLPSPRYGTSAAWDGTYAYIFGGVTASSNTEHADVLRYDPGTDTLVTLSAVMPTARYHTSAAFIAGTAYVFGGFPCTSWPHSCDEILRFEPATGNLTVDNITLTTGRYLTSAAANATHAYIFGGYTGTRTKQILSFGGAVLPPPPPGNQVPSIAAVADVLALAGDSIAIGVTATDPDGDTLTLGAAPLPGNATFADHGDGTGTLTWHTAASDVGTYTITVTADDGSATDSTSFQIEVTGDPPPTFDPIDDVIVDEGDEVVVLVSASDPEGQPVTLGNETLPTGATFEDHGGGLGTFTWDTTFDQAGIWTINLTVSDANHTVVESFDVTVNNVDRAPVIAAAGPFTFVEGQTGSAIVTASDPDDDPIIMTASGLVAGAAFNDLGAGTGEILWTPALGDRGTYTFTVRADANGAFDTETVTIKVVPEVDFRIAPLGPSIFNASPGEVLNLTVNVKNTGSANDTIVFRALSASGGAGWTLVPPVPITLETGETKEVGYTVIVGNSGVFAKPRLIAESSVKPSLTRMLTWIVHIPVVLDVVLDDDTPTLVEGSAATNIGGTVIARWWDGRAAAGVPIRVTQHPDNLEALAGSVQGAANSTGNYTFSFPMLPSANLPGGHTLLVESTRSSRTDSIEARYVVGVA